MFIALHGNKILLNTDFIVHIKEIPKRNFSDVPSDIYTMDDLIDMGFLVGKTDVYEKASSWESAEEIVRANEGLALPKSRSGMKPGYWRLESGSRGLLNGYVEKDGTYHRDDSGMGFLAKNRWDEPYAYELMMSDGSTMYMTLAEHMKFIMLLNPLMLGSGKNEKACGIG